VRLNLLFKQQCSSLNIGDEKMRKKLTRAEADEFLQSFVKDKSEVPPQPVPTTSKEFFAAMEERHYEEIQKLYDDVTDYPYSDPRKGNR
jgi:hypothetical protein